VTQPSARDRPRTARKEKRLTFAPGKALLVSRAAILATLSLALVAMIALLPPIPLDALALLGGVLVAYGLLFLLSPLLTNHWLTRSRLILRQGWYFRTVIPFSEIESIVPADREGPLHAPLGVHRPLGQPVMFVTGGRTGLMTLRLRRPRRFWQSFGLAVREIVFDVSDRTRFLEAYEERRSLLAPVEPERPYA